MDHDHVADLVALGADVVERPVGDDAALGDDDRAGAGRLDLAQVVRREEHGALFPDLLDVPDDLRLLVGIEIGGGLVEDQDRRIVHQRLPEADALAVAVGEGADVLAEHLGQAADVDDPLHPLLERGLVQAAHVSDELEVLPDAHVLVEGARCGR